MAKGCSSNNYEEARKQRLEANKKRFEDLGISKISKKLTEIASPAKKKTPHHLPKLKPKTTNSVVEPRRSSRVRNPVPSYREEVSMDFQTSRKRSRSHSSSWGSYVARPLDEIKEATDEERSRALEAAEALENNLQSSNPSFIKSMVRSHVYSCFWLGLPSKFCEEYLPKTVYKYDMILEDENGSEYEAVYIGERSGLSGGWRGFALEHKLDDGDALVFQLVEAARFKIYIVRAFPDSAEEVGKDFFKEEGNMRATKAQKTASNPESGSNKTKKKKQAIVNETKESETNSSRKMEKKSKVPATAESKGEAPIETAKPKTAIKVSNKTRKSKEGSVHEIGDSGNTEQPLAENNTVKPRGVNRGKEKESVQIQNADSEIKKVETVEVKKVDSGNTEQPLSENNTVKPRGANRGKKKESVQNADSGIKKVEPVGGASKSVSQTPRKKPAPKFFRKKA